MNEIVADRRLEKSETEGAQARRAAAGASGRKLNDIRPPSVIHSDLGFRPLHIVPESGT